MTGVSRRAFALGLPPGAMALPLVGLAGYAAATPQAQIRVGRFAVTALADGYADMPYNYFPGRTPEQIGQAAQAQFVARPGGLRFLFNQYLIEDGERRILIDAGPAGSLGQSGMLPKTLAALGLRPDQIDAVIVTHMHQDHIGGLVAGGQNRFPNAELYIDRRDVAHWTDPAKQSGAPDYLQPSFRLSADVVRLYPRLQAIDGERQITPPPRRCGRDSSRAPRSRAR
jgi:glyoxylase-like metal-dependent hydrolase (beta-lactamase superfamily II)